MKRTYDARFSLPGLACQSARHFYAIYCAPALFWPGFSASARSVLPSA